MIVFIELVICLLFDFIVVTVLTFVILKVSPALEVSRKQELKEYLATNTKNVTRNCQMSMMNQRDGYTDRC